VAQQAPVTGMRGAAVQGAFWSIALAVGNKAVTTVGQVALAWYLFPRDMGIVAMAASVVALATFFTASGIDDLLVQRHDSYEQDATQVFWLSLCFNVVAMAVAVALIPFAVRHFGDGRVGRLMLIQAASWPVSTVTLVLRPQLANVLRFKAIAAIRLGEGVVFTGCAVFLAAQGWGPYALVWPTLFSAIFSAAAFWCLADRPPMGWPKPVSWPAYITPGLLLMVGNFVGVMAIQMPNFIIGSLMDARGTGLYAWGYLVASQAIFLLVLNLRGLFTPLFSKLKSEPERLAKATAQAAYAITAVVAPICVLQAFFARPLIETFFPARWTDAVLVVYWLSLGFCAQPVALITQAALIAKARFGLALRLALLQAVLGALGVAWGCLKSGIEGAAVGAAVSAVLCLPLNLWILRGEVGCSWLRLLDAPKAILFGALAFLPSWGIFWAFGGAYHWWSNAAEGVAYCAVLALVYRLFDPGMFDELSGLRSLMRGAPGKLPDLSRGEQCP
jgi:teichuronic acid exporter